MNLLARQDRAQLEQLLTLGQALREATETLAGAQLRTLGQQRHQVVYALAQQARRLADQPVTDAIERELEATLEAALADPAAADAVRSGRLVRALSANGLDPVELGGAVAAPALPITRPPAARPGPSAGAGGGRAAEPPAGDKAEHGPDPRKVAAARDVVTAAERAATQAGSALERARAAADEAAQDERELRARVAELDRQLADARAAQQRATGQARDRAREREQAQRADRSAQRELNRAREALERATKGR